MKDELRQLKREQFPPLLDEIPDKPKELWARGTLPLEDRTLICVIGSRRMTAYGKQACEHIISGLRDAPVTIVSGLALGVDACAHRAALAANLPTIAVPGSGLNWNVVYPRSHESLAREIVQKGGGLLSEYAPDFKATDWSFPRRNRIMAGMSHAVLLIEAEIKSGSLITMRLAADYNRECLVVPGSIFSAFSRGGHMLAKKGAALVESAEDVRDVLGIASGASHDHTIEMPHLSPAEETVWRLLETPTPRDELLRSLKLPTAEAQTLLSIMELKGYIVEEMSTIRRG